MEGQNIRPNVTSTDQNFDEQIKSKINRSQIDMQIRCNLDAIQIQTRCKLDLFQMQSRCNLNAAKKRLRCKLDATQILRCNVGATLMQPRHYLQSICNIDATQTQPKHNLEATQMNLNDTLMQFRSNLDPIIKFRSKTDQNANHLCQKS